MRSGQARNVVVIAFCSTAVAILFPLSSTASLFNLAGAEGFEPPSSVLETDSLTVELTPLWSCSSGTLARVPLFHFFVRLVFAAPGTELFQFDAVRCRLAVLGG